jgi:serine/threonine protein kinase
MAMKVPRMASDDGAENIVSFEIEHQLMQVLGGAHVPRFVAAGDLSRVPYLVMEYVQGKTLQHWLDEARASKQLARGSQHHPAGLTPWRWPCTACIKQNTVHLDLKPANVLIREDGSAVLLDFGLSMAMRSIPTCWPKQLRKAVGSPAWIAPEQVVGVRGDPRSDIFAMWA